MSTREYAALVALLDEVYEATTTVVSGLDEESFDERTRTELWSVKDLLFHQMCDAQRALVVFTTEPDQPADTTAVSYWSTWQPGQAGADAHARYAAKAAAAYGGSHFLVAQWTETSRAAVRAARQHGPAGTVATQGHVLAPGDFVHTLAVEGVVHHLDLTLEVPSPGLPDAAYELVVEVLTGLLGTDLPTAWSAEESVLKGTGRQPLSDEDRESLGAAVASFPSSADGVPSRDGHREGRRGPGRLRAHEPQATLDKAIGLIEAAAARGAQIVVFPEAFIPGHADLDRLPADLGRRRGVVRGACRPGGRRSRAGDRSPSAPPREPPAPGGDGRRGAGAPRVDDLQHDPVPRTGRGARSASTAS